MRRDSGTSYRLADLENVLSERGWSQADLARRSGLSTPTVGRAAAGREEVSARSASKIASALRMQVGTLCRDRREASVNGTETPLDNANECLDFDPRRMREEMNERGMIPTEIADRAKLSAATVSSALRGARKPRENTVARIAAVFGKAPAELCSGAGEDFYSPALGLPEKAQAGELRLVAGQYRTTVYPEGSDQDGKVSKPGKEEVTPAVAKPEGAEDSPSAETLGGLLSRLQQARQMVESLVDYLGNLEAQVGRAIASEGEHSREANTESGSR